MEDISSLLYDFSLVIPAFNEEENVSILMEEIHKAFQNENLKGQVVFIDDGSTDETFKQANSYKMEMNYLKVLRHHRNLGKTEAILTGVQASDSTVIILLDADLQFSPMEIPRFLNKINEGYDIVTGRKMGKYQKKTVSGIYNWLCQKLFAVPVTDMNSMKAFRKKIFDKLHLRHDWHRFFVALAVIAGYTATEIDVKLYPRMFGIPKYSGYGRIFIGILDLLAVKFKITFVRKPLLFFGTIGFSLIGLGIFLGLVSIYMRVVLQSGFRPLLYLVILLIIVGVISFIGGLIGEIVSDLTDRFDQITKRDVNKNKNHKL